MSRGLSKTLVSSVLSVLAVGCERDQQRAAQSEPSVAPPSRATDAPALDLPEPSVPAAPIVQEAVLTRGREIAVPAGKLRAGSPTGTKDRDPSHEADDVAIALGAFKIDALPYPNDPAQAFRSDVDRSEASALCAAEGKRLCSELEWERACKGDENLAYPALANEFDPARCKASLGACRSAFDVLALGALGREWTDSKVTRGLGDTLRTAVVRGAGPGAKPAQHRCAARDAATPDSKSRSLLFRCCRGERNNLTYPEEAERERFVEKTLSREKLAEVLKSMPALSDVAEIFRLFSAKELDQGLDRARTSRARMAPWVAAPSMLVWSPVHGEEVWVLSGDTPRGALLIVLYPLRDGSYTLIGSFETAQEHAPFVIGYKPDAPKELLFSTCWGCGGEGGAISLGEDARITIAPR